MALMPRLLTARAQTNAAQALTVMQARSRDAREAERAMAHTPADPPPLPRQPRLR